MPQKNTGFTLIELLVVITLITLFSLVVLTAVFQGRKESRDLSRISDVGQMKLGVKLYKEAVGEYPEYPDGIEMGTGQSIDVELSSFLAGDIADPINKGDFVYWYDSSFDCGGTFYVVIMALEMELEKNANFNDVCGESLSTEPPSTFLSHFATPADGYHVVYSQGYYQGYYQGSYFYSQAEYYAEGSYYNQSTYDGGSQGTYYSESGYSTQELNLTPEQLAGSYIVILD